MPRRERVSPNGSISSRACLKAEKEKKKKTPYESKERIGKEKTGHSRLLWGGSRRLTWKGRRKGHSEFLQRLLDVFQNGSLLNSPGEKRAIFATTVGMPCHRGKKKEKKRVHC